MKSKLRQELIRLRDELSLSDIVYCLDIDNLDNCFKYFAAEHKVLNALYKRRGLYSCDDSGTRLWERQIRHLQQRPAFLQEYFSNRSSWHRPQLNPRCREAQRLFAIQSLLVPCRGASGLAGRFILMAESRQQWQTLEDDPQALLQRLQAWQYQYAQPTAAQVNPLVDYQIISSVSHHILKRLAHGNQRSEIAKEMRLTKRGVDYHIGVLKELLKAKNTAHLVLIGSHNRLL
ncbi:regulatory protein, luxR family [Ferrimonas sediminum]|uniref:Regulatory protein, luxR family n=1 Tax=Ferrimonas sediminum TaxID=718193 RepID=A0A1G8JJZ6_9GAMM|nr:LuxR C-terminal-related transcriptional regulator [Ferrimonas sediminum]SDI31538.1 regulatory protein, luxR family [Ferrimonas sediminum]